MGAGRFDLVQRAVERGEVDPEMRLGPDEMPLLHLAVSKGAVELARYLIFDRGVDPTVKVSSLNLTALHLAISHGHNEAALFLINDVPGVDVNAPLSNGVTPLMLAAAAWHFASGAGAGGQGRGHERQGRGGHDRRGPCRGQGAC